MAEDPCAATFRALLGPARGVRVLELGGASLAGWAADGGAADYRALPAAELDGWSGHADGTYDLVASWMAVQRTRNLARLLGTVHHHLRPGGRLVLAVPHPVATAAADGGPAAYFREGERKAGGEVVRHRTLQSYSTELRLAGFELVELAEARSDTDGPPGERPGGRPSGGPAGPADELPDGLVLRCRRAGVSV
ncbi:methyltransferase domain-containing protein [Actinomadura logoneensis]|uniref:Methyltransferase domain-containing protein n=1 Tax=Actinomadura logoneensis TaxID=2293572 RepID=A0A372JQS3_9ACTN|nr:methyltransferase domain-containing protein [Actinomadura logoneensis]RFU42299.1 methyltransferase domain-containing protein [Actinomadura logoneensis]